MRGSCLSPGGRWRLDQGGGRGGGQKRLDVKLVQRQSPWCLHVDRVLGEKKSESFRPAPLEGRSCRAPQGGQRGRLGQRQVWGGLGAQLRAVSVRPC